MGRARVYGERYDELRDEMAEIRKAGYKAYGIEAELKMRMDLYYDFFTEIEAENKRFGRVDWVKWRTRWRPKVQNPNDFLRGRAKVQESAEGQEGGGGVPKETQEEEETEV